MKVTPKKNIQQLQNSTIVNKIRTVFFNGKVKLKTLLCDVFEKKRAEVHSQEYYDKRIRSLLPYYEKEIPSELRVPNIAASQEDYDAIRAWCPKYFNEADKNYIFSIKDVKERNALLDEWLKEGRATYDRDKWDL